MLKSSKLDHFEIIKSLPCRHPFKRVKIHYWFFSSSCIEDANLKQQYDRTNLMQWCNFILRVIMCIWLTIIIKYFFFATLTTLQRRHILKRSVERKPFHKYCRSTKEIHTYLLYAWTWQFQYQSSKTNIIIHCNPNINIGAWTISYILCMHLVVFSKPIYL